MENCKNCTGIITLYDTIGKTYYRLDEDTVLCYRHWHQAGRPEFFDKGEYSEVFSKNSIAKVREAKLKKKNEKKFKAPERIWDGL